MLPNAFALRLNAAAHVALAWLELRVLVWGTLAQFLVLVAAFLLVRLVRSRLTGFLAQRAQRLRHPSLVLIGMALAAAVPWLLLALLLRFASAGFERAGEATPLLRLAISLVLAWAVIRLCTRLVRDPRLARAIAVLAWIVAALNIAGLLGATLVLLDSMSVTMGALRVSVLLVVKALLVLLVALWVANVASRVLDSRLRALPELTPAMQVLATKLSRAVLLTLAVVLALGTVGIDLTAFAVFSGAIGVGVGFGLQKVVSNLISGVILLLDSSIKPGDVIQLEGTYGWITQLNARYVSVVTRDGTEHLIPNEDLITQRVVNWTYSNDQVRLRVPVGIAYGADPREGIRVCLAAAARVGRVLAEPPPACLLTGFGDSTVNLELRFWIEDARAGTANVRSEVLLQVWDGLKAAGIALPFPQRDVHIIDDAPDAASRA